MSSNIVKCNNCNIVISEVLCFVQNKIEVMDNESLVQLCIGGFKEEDITTAKVLLQQSIPTTKRIVQRKSKGKASRNVGDIINIMKSVDPELIPIFVARELSKLPPITFDHIDVTRLLKDILVLKTDMEYVKNNYVTKANFEKLENSIYTMKKVSLSSEQNNINIKRGAWISNSEYLCNSGPMGLMQDCNNLELKERVEGNNIQLLERAMTAEHLSNNCNTVQEVQGQLNQSIPFCPSDKVYIGSPGPCNDRHTVVSDIRTDTNSEVRLETQAHKDISFPHNCHREDSDIGRFMRVEAGTVVSNNQLNQSIATQVSHLSCNNEGDNLIVSHCEGQHTYADTVKSKDSGRDWTKIKYKRKIKNRFLAQKGKGLTDSAGSFRAAETTIPFYIYNVDKGAKTKDIENYIYEKTQVSVQLNKIFMKQSKGYEAYKFDIPYRKLSVFMDENMWPDGVAFRRYVYFKKTDRNNAILVKKLEENKLLNG